MAWEEDKILFARRDGRRCKVLKNLFPNATGVFVQIQKPYGFVSRRSSSRLIPPGFRKSASGVHRSGINAAVIQIIQLLDGRAFARSKILVFRSEDELSRRGEYFFGLCIGRC